MTTDFQILILPEGRVIVGVDPNVPEQRRQQAIAALEAWVSSQLTTMASITEWFVVIPGGFTVTDLREP